MSIKTHGIMEDISADIGYTAANSLVDWFGGGNVAIPTTVAEDHPICKIIGSSAFSKLVGGYGGTTVWIPLGYQREMDRRDRMIATLFALGLGAKQIASVAGMSEDHVQKVRLRVERLGVLPLILKKAGVNVGDQSPYSPWSKRRANVRIKSRG